MAQSQTNLVVGIITDTSKAKADLRLFSAEIQKFTKELNDAVKAGNEAAAADARQNIEQRYRLIEQTTAAIKKKTAATQADTRANREHGLSVREAAIETSHFLHTAGLGIEAAKALRFGFAGFLGAEFIRNVTEGITKINELNNAIKAMAPGGDPRVLKAIRESVRATGQDAEIGTKAYENFLKVWNEAHLKALESGTMTTTGVNLLSGHAEQLGNTIQDLQSVARGGQGPRPLDWSDPFYTVTGRRTGRDPKKDWKDLATAILAIKDPTLQNEAAQRNYNATFAQMEKTLREVASEELKIEPGPTKAQADTLAEYNKHMAESASLLDKIQTSLGYGFASTVNKGVKFYGEAIQKILQLDRTLQEASQPSARALVPPRPGAPTEAPESDSNVSGGVPEAPGFAPGGYIRGAGSATSDSILARLSNGEFVINARSARRLGTGFLQRLNRYASGGNVTGLDYDPSVTDFTGGAPDYRADRPQLSTHERRVLTDAFNKWRAGPGGRAAAPLLAGETDEEYFKRTGYHYGPRPGDPRETPLRVDPTQTPLRVDPTQIPLYFGGGLVTAPPIRFAEGGLAGAATAAATPIHLHIGGGVFPVNASSGVAAALIVEAKHSQMVSSGIKPSWYGR